jgi:hypothetical protein
MCSRQELREVSRVVSILETLGFGEPGQGGFTSLFHLYPTAHLKPQVRTLCVGSGLTSLAETHQLESPPRLSEVHILMVGILLKSGPRTALQTEGKGKACEEAQTGGLGQGVPSPSPASIRARRPALYSMSTREPQMVLKQKRSMSRCVF